MDIKLKTDEGRFNYRVSAVIIHNGKILAMKDERSPYYYLPGGRVSLNETAENAVLREIKEELNMKAEIIRPLWLNQSFFTEDVSKEKYHEICLYFLVNILNNDFAVRGDKFVIYENKHINKFEWLDLKKLKTEYFYPLFLKEKIFELPENLTLITEYE